MTDRKKFSWALLIILVFSCFPLIAEIVFTPSEWDLGRIEADLDFPGTLTIENRGADPVKISLMSTCGCLTVEPQDFILEAGLTAKAVMNFDSSDDTGEFEKIIIVRTTDPGLPKAFFMVRGFVDRETVADEPETVKNDDTPSIIEDEAGGDSLIFDYYYSPTCRECREFLAERVPELSEELEKNVMVNGKDIQEPAVFEELEERLTGYGLSSTAFPVVIFEDRVLQGEKEIQKSILSLLAGEYSGTETEERDISRTDTRDRLKILPIIAAGLLDGVNPCAFTTLIFLLTALAVAGKTRKEILVIGIFFTGSVYITYFLVGLGFFSVLRMAESFTIVSQIIRWVLVAVLVIFAVLSFYDYLKIRKNRTSEILLQLPKGMKKRIHASVRTYTRSTALIGSSIVMGFLVSIFELGCTGQIYFPTLTYMIKTEGGFSGYFMLGLYNIAFIVPLILVFWITYRGVSSDRLTSFFQKHLGTVKLVTVFLFIILAVITILS